MAIFVFLGYHQTY